MCKELLLLAFRTPYLPVSFGFTLVAWVQGSEATLGDDNNQIIGMLAKNKQKN